MDQTSSISELVLTPQLLRAAAILKASPLFVDITGDGHSYHQKQTLFLVLAGEKPVGEALSGHIERLGDRGRAVADNPDEVGTFLSSLGLAYDLSDSDESVTQAFVSLDPTLLQQYRTALTGDAGAAGRLFGYPDTAVAAFAAGPDWLLPPDDQDRYVRAAGLMAMDFRLSKDHWREELATVARWQVLIRAAGLADDQPATLDAAA